jgi:hypothetical protein
MSQGHFEELALESSRDSSAAVPGGREGATQRGGQPNNEELYCNLFKTSDVKVLLQFPA